jgi:hypothetical protein
MSGDESIACLNNLSVRYFMISALCLSAMRSTALSSEKKAPT